MNSIKLRHDNVISDVTANRFRLELSLFGTCEYYNLTRAVRGGATPRQCFYMEILKFEINIPNYLLTQQYPSPIKYVYH